MKNHEACHRKVELILFASVFVISGMLTILLATPRPNADSAFPAFAGDAYYRQLMLQDESTAAALFNTVWKNAPLSAAVIVLCALLRFVLRGRPAAACAVWYAGLFGAFVWLLAPVMGAFMLTAGYCVLAPAAFAACALTWLAWGLELLAWRLRDLARGKRMETKEK